MTLRNPKQAQYANTFNMPTTTDALFLNLERHWGLGWLTSMCCLLETPKGAWKGPLFLFQSWNYFHNHSPPPLTWEGHAHLLGLWSVLYLQHPGLRSRWVPGLRRQRAQRTAIHKLFGFGGTYSAAYSLAISTGQRVFYPNSILK